MFCGWASRALQVGTPLEARCCSVVGKLVPAPAPSPQTAPPPAPQACAPQSAGSPPNDPTPSDSEKMKHRDCELCELKISRVAVVPQANRRGRIWIPMRAETLRERALPSLATRPVRPFQLHLPREAAIPACHTSSGLEPVHGSGTALVPMCLQTRAQTQGALSAGPPARLATDPVRTFDPTASAQGPRPSLHTAWMAHQPPNQPLTAPLRTSQSPLHPLAHLIRIGLSNQPTCIAETAS
jgi:hypothetical protein